MRISALLAVAACLVAALLIGACMAWLDLSSAPSPAAAQSSWRPDGVQFAPENGPQPEVDVEELTHDFGESTPETNGSHTFVFRNTGKYDLQLVEGPTDCRCMVSQSGEGASDSSSGDEKWTIIVAPGESAEITLMWETVKSPGLFRKQATIWTNDRLQERVDLTIYGHIRAHVEIRPTAVSVAQMLSDETVEKQLQVQAARFDHLTILGHRMEKNPVAEFIDVQYESLPDSEVPDDCASAATVTVTIKPGLPFGTSTQTIWLSTNEPNTQELEIPVYAYVTRDIDLAGNGYSSRTGELRLGVVQSAKGVQRDLMLLAKGPHRTDVEFQISSTEPDCLHVELGQPKRLESVTQVPLLVTISPGAEPISRLGLGNGKTGEIIIETSHPKIKQLRVPVKFAVEG